MRPHEDWPDRAEFARWEKALRDAADRVRRERGVDVACELTVAFEGLWVHYGDLAFRVDGDQAEVRTPGDLFEEIDWWVAFQRPAGPGVRLERDRRAMAEWRAQVPARQRLWEQVTPRVFRDVTAAAGREIPWRIVVRDTETVWPEWPDPPRPGVWVVAGEFVPRERQLDFPVVAIELPHTRIDLPPPDDMEDVENAVADLAGAVQDEIIEEVHGAWPKCLVHEHPMVADVGPDAVAVWRCPQDASVSVRIGEWRLGSSGAGGLTTT